MNCPADYVCNATPAWLVIAMIGGMFALVALVVVVLTVLDWRDRR